MTTAEIAAAINTALIVIGWAVVHFASRSRDRDKARRELIVKAVDGLSDQVTKHFSVALAYHSSPSRDLTKEIELKIGLQDLSRQTQFVNGTMRPTRDGVQSSDLLNAFKKSVTGVHFEDEWMSALLPNSEQLNLIAASALALRTYYAETKYEQFRD